MIIEIKSRNNEKIKYACALKERKYQQEQGCFIDETFHSLEMALSQNLLTDVFVTKKLPLPPTVNQYIVPFDLLKKVAYSSSPEVVFIAKIPTFESKPKMEKILYLDHISDPGNMGTLIRSALAFGYDAVIYSKNSVYPYNSKAIMASKGAIYKIPVFEDELKNYVGNYQIIVSSLDKKSQNLYETKIEHKHILVVGNETHGVSEKCFKLASTIVKIPMNPQIDSLNVAVAGGILMAYCNK